MKNKPKRLYFTYRKGPGLPYRTYTCERAVLPMKDDPELLWVGVDYHKGLEVQKRQNAFERKRRLALHAFYKRFPGGTPPEQLPLFTPGRRAERGQRG